MRADIDAELDGVEISIVDVEGFDGVALEAVTNGMAYV